MRPAAIIAVVLTLLTGHAPALACGNAVMAMASLNLEDARVALDDGDVERARRIAAHELSGAPDPWHRRHAEWILAMSTIRDDEASAVDVERAIGTMRKVHAERERHEGVAEVDLGEALARLPEHEAEALAVLEPLAKRDLIGTAYAWAALGRIAPDSEDRARAIRRCETLSDGAAFCSAGWMSSRTSRDRLGRRVLAAFGAAFACAPLLAVAVFVRRRRIRYAAFSRCQAP